MHICSKSVDDASYLLKIARDAGIKRAGIISIGNKVTIEIIGTEFLETILSEKKRLLVDKRYLKRLVLEANNKLKLNNKKIKKLESILSKALQPMQQ